MPAYVYSDSDEGSIAAPKPRPEGTLECDGCNGSGVFYGAGAVVNGKFVGYTGTCYRCGGKGHQTESDRKRNWGYDQNRRFSL